MLTTTRFAVLLALGAAPIALSALVPSALWLGLAYVAAVIVLGIIDWRMTPGLSSIEAERRCEDKLSLGAENIVRIYLRNRGRVPLSIMVRDEPPYQFLIEGNEADVNLGPREEEEISYTVIPHARGDFAFGDIYVRFKGPLGFVMRQQRLPAESTVKVYPNLLDLHKYDLLLRRGQTLEAGTRRTRLFGRGTEFESLRDYVPDDEFRQVDWKATARRGRMTSRQYQVERTQNVIILLDTGRTMSVRVEDMTKLDYAINAALMLAYAVASGDDKIGLLAFSDKVNLFLPPRKGRAQALTIAQGLYNVQPTTDESGYSSAFAYLAHRWRKRSLVVVFTDLLDPESSRQVITHLQVLSSRHLCMCVAISDVNVLASAAIVPDEASEVYEKAAAIEVLHDRRQAIGALERAGVIVVDAEPAQLSPAVVAKYLEIKTRLRL